jgi:hypothetical protein
MAIRIPIISEFDDKGLARATRQFKELGTAGEKAQFAIQKAAIPATLAMAGLAAGAYKAIEAGSDLAESQAKVGQIFGSSAKEIEKFASTAAKKLGQSKQDVLNAAGVFGTFGKAAGLAGKDLAKFSNDFTGLASDLASFNNTTPDEAINAIGAALRGESEPLRKYGVLLDDATLRAEALKLGIYDGNGALNAQQKILAAQSQIFKQTSDAQGDFERTSGGLANQQRILKAEMANLATTIGQALLPIVQAILPVVGAFGSWIADNTPLVIGLGVAIGGVATAITITNFAMNAWNALTKITAALNAVLGTSFTALWVATGVGIIAAIIAAVVLLNEKFQFMDNVINFVKEAFSNFYSAVRGYIDALYLAFKNVFNSIAKLWNNTIGKLSFKVPSWVPIFGGRSWSVPQIPELAEGGIVTGPTLAMIGEKGPEAVIPLDRMMRGNITVNVAGSVTSERDLVETIRKGLVDAQRNGAQLVYSNV